MRIVNSDKEMKKEMKAYATINKDAPELVVPININKEFMKEIEKIMWKQIKDIAEKIERKMKNEI